MLNLSACTIIETRPVEIAAGITSIQEGCALVYVLENGVNKMKPSTGAAGEFYAGVALGNPVIPTRTNKIESIKVPATSPYTVTLARAPLADPFIAVEAAGANPRVVLAKAGAASSTEYAISGSVVTLHSSFAGRTLTVMYPYSISYAEVIQGLPGFDASRVTDLTSVPALGCIAVGEIYTDMFDPSVDWASFSSSNRIKLAANGMFTIGGSGTTIEGVVTALPTVTNGYLGMRIPAY